MAHLKWISGAIIRLTNEDDFGNGATCVLTGARVAFTGGWLYVDLEHSDPPRGTDGIMVYPAHRVQHVRFPAPSEPLLSPDPEPEPAPRVHVGQTNGQLVW
ncbi:MAG TPA: hypothetical protein VGX23_34740 [Actinocrinis sp.]|nr:hypothetical protein [Actinocrinis sp.]